MKPWGPTSPTWYAAEGIDRAEQEDSLDDAIATYLELCECDAETVPEVVRVNLYVDFCDQYYGEPTDCAGESEHYIDQYATAFVPIRAWLARAGWDDS